MAKNRQQPRPLDLRYLYGGVVQYRPGDRIAPRIMRDYELVLMIEGTATYQLKGTDHTAPPGTIIFSRPGFREAYTWDTAGRTRHAYFHFHIDHLPEDWPNEAGWPVVIHQPDAAIPALFTQVVERISTESDWRIHRPGNDACRLIECMIRILLHPLRHRMATTDAYPEAVGQALHLMREVLDTQPRRSLNLHDLATKAGVSEKHLCRLFTQTIGHAPMKTFTLLKLQLAIALLARSNFSIKEIAGRCGFDNPLYFTRCFTQACHASPTQVRNRLRAGRSSPPPDLLPSAITPRLHW